MCMSPCAIVSAMSLQLQTRHITQEPPFIKKKKKSSHSYWKVFQEQDMSWFNILGITSCWSPSEWETFLISFVILCFLCPLSSFTWNKLKRKVCQKSKKVSWRNSQAIQAYITHKLLLEYIADVFLSMTVLVMLLMVAKFIESRDNLKVLNSVGKSSSQYLLENHATGSIFAF